MENVIKEKVRKKFSKLELGVKKREGLGGGVREGVCVKGI
jgi:hypothetical protein